MRLLSLIIFHFISLAGFCQQAPVLFDIKTERSPENKYIIIIHATVPKGWHVYAADDSTNGLQAIHTEFDNQNISTLPLISDQLPVSITDNIFDNQSLKVYRTSFTLTQPIHIEGTVPASLSVTVKGFAANQTEFLPIEETKEIQLEGGFIINKGLKLSSVDINNPVSGCGDKQGSKGILAIFLLGFGGGLVALLTPCIFPMIPVTVSFFTGKAKSKKQGIRNGLLYGSYIFLIYLLASSPFHLIGNINPQIFNIISTNPFVNVFFFAVFIFFALSFFGLFEIKLPSSIANTTANKGGIFFMALTLTVVSFSCTGIILGSLMVNALSASGNAWQLTAGMGGFGAALALPFGLFAMFPQWMQRLPKSGGWLNTVKKALAFVELALAIKFLSNADLVEHWGILKREVFIGLWVLIALALGLYLLGVFDRKQLVANGMQNADKLKMQKPKLSFGRIAFGSAVLLFAVYLLPGLTATKYANLKALSGFPPPLSYSIYGKNNVHGKGLEPNVINDYEKAIALSRKTNKPLLIDFTGWACVNCRKMEEQVWTNPAIQQLIKDNYILVSLYVDDRKKLPTGKTVGETWAGFQADNFKQVTQPLYVILSPDEQLMNHPVGYTPKEETYKQWLECGITAFKQNKPLAHK
ncbi:MAG: thioredoxin family protein [Bacteroidota bacterium]|nr:thioredoxin family protein [Bacteroidota bacterium]